MKWIKNLKMIQKLLSAFIIVALFICIVGSIAIVNMNNLNNNIDTMYNGALMGTTDILYIKANLLQIQSDTLLILNPANKGNLEKYKETVAALKTKDDAWIADYKTKIVGNIDSQQFANFEKLLTNYRV